MSTYTLTPSLVVGDPPAKLSNVRQVDNAADALAHIRSRGVAVLPDFGLVTEILSAVGLTPEEIAMRVAMSGGHVPVPDEPFA